MDPIHARYAELLDAGFPGGQVCLTWCRNSDLEEVARRFGAVPETGLWATPDELEDLEYEHGEELVELTTMGEWTIAMEPSGFQGVRSAVLEPLSVGGCAFGVFWNEELDNEVAYAVDGQIVTSFDLTDIGQRSGSDPAALDELLQQVGLHDGLPAQARKARILALGEAISGQRLTPRWLRSDQFTILVTDPLPDPLVPAALLNPRAPFLDEPEMARILANPSLPYCSTSPSWPSLSPSPRSTWRIHLVRRHCGCWSTASARPANARHCGRGWPGYVPRPTGRPSGCGRAPRQARATRRCRCGGGAPRSSSWSRLWTLLPSTRPAPLPSGPGTLHDQNRAHAHARAEQRRRPHRIRPATPLTGPEFSSQRSAHLPAADTPQDLLPHAQSGSLPNCHMDPEQ
ncbi:DUF6461 domain-containing protein [Streptosporangium lutulentum]